MTPDEKLAATGDKTAKEASEWLFHPEILQAKRCPDLEACDIVALDTQRGEVTLRICTAPNAENALLMVGGTGGGFDSPARDLYPRISQDLMNQGMICVQAKFRNPTDLGEAVHDVIAAAQFLLRRGVKRICLMGHSFGGAVIITAAGSIPEVTSVITLATQSFGTGEVSDLAPKSILLIHGTADEILTPHCSVQVFRTAKEPKEIHLLKGAGHVLDESAEEVYRLVRSWTLEKLGIEERRHVELAVQKTLTL